MPISAADVEEACNAKIRLAQAQLAQAAKLRPPLPTTNHQPPTTHSTGPRTPEGKARSSMNALKHGLSAKTPTLPNEDPAEYQALLDSLLAQFPPRNPIDRALVERLAHLTRQLSRLAAAETQVFLAYQEANDDPEATAAQIVAGFFIDYEFSGRYSRRENSVGLNGG